MQRKQAALLGLMLLILAVMVALLPWSVHSAPTKTYRYKVELVSLGTGMGTEAVQESLNAQGAAGWELVSFEIQRGTLTQFVLVFKR